MYKDKDRQREANRDRQRRYKAKHKGVTSEGVTTKSVTGIDKALLIVRDELKQEDELIDRVVKSDVLNIPKRGKDIKVFEDLPPDVQRSIDMMSMVDGQIDEANKANRTAIAISYQHSHSQRFCLLWCSYWQDRGLRLQRNMH